MMTARPGLSDRMSTAVEPSRPSLPQLVSQQTAEVEKALPTHLKSSAPAYVRALVTVLKQTPRLMECDPTTVLGGLMTASSLGLEFGPLGHCYLVPFRNTSSNKTEAQFILGFKGVIDLAWRSGKLKSIAARSVHDGDEFDYDYGLADSLHHKPDVRSDRGPAYAYYCMAKFDGGGHYFVVMSQSDVEKHRQRSKSKDRGPWVTDYDKMACKTTVLESKPYLPLTTEVLRDLALDGVVARGLTADTVETEEVDYIDAEAVDTADPGWEDPDTRDADTAGAAR